MKSTLHLFIASFLLTFSICTAVSDNNTQGTAIDAPFAHEQQQPEMHPTVASILAHIDGMNTISARTAHDLVLCINQLTHEQRVSLVHALENDFAPPLTRGSSLPSSLVQALEQERSAGSSTASHPKLDLPRRRFTTLTIAPNATSSCFLPRVFSFSRQGKYFMFLALAIGIATGIITAITLERILGRNIKREPSISPLHALSSQEIEYQRKMTDLNLMTNGIGIGSGLLITLIIYASLVGNYKKDQDILVAEFIEKEWPTLRERMIWPQHVVSILDYLYHKMEKGTFNLQEAKQCIGALHEPGKVT